MKVLTQEDFVEEIFELVAVRVEPVFATAIPVQSVRVAQERDCCNTFFLTQAAECFQLTFGHADTNGIPRLFDVLRCCGLGAFIRNTLAKIFGRYIAELVFFKQLVHA